MSAKLITALAVLIGNLCVDRTPTKPVQSYAYYLPVIHHPPCAPYNVDARVVPAQHIYAGKMFTVTIYLHNIGCSAIGYPHYSLSAFPIWETPSRHAVTGGAGLGETISHTFQITAPFTVSQAIRFAGGAYFEVSQLPPPGPFSYGSAFTEMVTKTVEQ